MSRKVRKNLELKLPHLLSMYGKAAFRLLAMERRLRATKSTAVGVIPVISLGAKCINKRDSAFYFYVDTLQASTPRGSDTDSDYANTMVRTTERHDRRRHREGQTQT